jgi:hypothetical protein
MIAAAVLAADIAGTLELGDTSEVRVRSTPALGSSGVTAPGTAPARGIDFFTRPDVHLTATDRRWDYSVLYAASFIAPDLEAGFTPQLLQLGSVRLGWHDRTVSLGVQQDGTYGIENSAYLVPTTTPTPGQPTAPQAAAAASAITYGYSRSTLTTGVKFERRTLGTATVEYLVSGGLDTPSQIVMPQLHGPRATASVDHTLAPTDHLITGVSAQQADFAPGPCINTTDPPGSTCQMTDQLAQLTEALRHRLSRSETFSGSLGVAASAVRYHPDAPFVLGVFPVVDTSYTRTFDRGGTLALFARVAPYLDIITGSVLSTAQGEVRLIYPVGPQLTLHLAASASQGLPVSDPAAVMAARGELGMNYLVSKRVDVSFGERWLWQENQGALGSLATAYGYLAVTVRERTLHF